MRIRSFGPAVTTGKRCLYRGGGVVPDLFKQRDNACNFQLCKPREEDKSQAASCVVAIIV